LLSSLSSLIVVFIAGYRANETRSVEVAGSLFAASAATQRLRTPKVLDSRQHVGQLSRNDAIAVRESLHKTSARLRITAASICLIHNEL
jgi:hypothetical protein